MSDYLGSYIFAKISGPPRQINRQFRTVSHGGVEGLTIWDLGLRADAFQVECLVYAYDLSQARAYYREIRELEDSEPVTLQIGDETEPDVLYQVMQVVPLECKRIVYGRGPGGPFYARLRLQVTLQPVFDV